MTAVAAAAAAVGGVVEKAQAKAHQTGGDLGNAWLKANSAGSGPYVLRSVRASELVTLDANPRHPTPPRLKRVVIRHVADPAVQLLLLQRLHELHDLVRVGAEAVAPHRHAHQADALQRLGPQQRLR